MTRYRIFNTQLPVKLTGVRYTSLKLKLATYDHWKFDIGGM